MVVVMAALWVIGIVENAQDTTFNDGDLVLTLERFAAAALVLIVVASYAFATAERRRRIERRRGR